MLGVPTANVDVEAGTIFPGRGVYAARAWVDGAWHRAAVNIGHNPTFQSRDERRFENADALVAQMRRDNDEAARLRDPDLEACRLEPASGFSPCVACATLA